MSSGANWPKPVRLVGIRIDPDSEGDPDVYTLEIREERPAMRDGSIVVFADPRLADAALALDDDPEVRTMGPVDTEVDEVYDIAATVGFLANFDADPKGTLILDSLNFLLDVLKALPGPWLAQVRDTLYPLADHLTFDSNYGDFLDQEPERRTKILDALYWAIGVAVTKTTIVRTLTESSSDGE